LRALSRRQVNLVFGKVEAELILVTTICSTWLFSLTLNAEIEQSCKPALRLHMPRLSYALFVSLFRLPAEQSGLLSLSSNTQDRASKFAGMPFKQLNYFAN